jgi:long-subunit acyl-CoA synthetase (AMP-forming)
VRRGDTVALMLTNRPEFHLLDLAVMHLGATPFSIYNTSSPEQIEQLFATAGNRLAICEEQFRDRVPDGLLPEEIDGDADIDWRAVSPDDVATLIFTSGTTGAPKAVELTHANVLYAVEAILQIPGAVVDDGRVLSYLPDAHMANRLFAHYVPLVTGARIITVREGKTALAVAQTVKPTLFVSVPMIWYKLRAALAQGGDLSAFGLDHVTLAISGGAPIAAETLEFFTSLGLPILEGWAMSETAGAGIINTPGAIRPGAVGLPVPGTEIALAADGELLVRSPGVMRGYRNDPEQTSAAIDADGWLHTGDVATVDADGYVTIVDRKKELIINSAGKNMSPANIENAVRTACPLVGSVIAVGDGRRHVVALLTLDPEATHDDRTQAEVEAGVARANATLSRVEQIRAFTILPRPWLPDSDELTPTMKVKRRAITQKYAAEIDALYAA